MGRIEKNYFLLTGISHKTAPVEIRENLSFGNKELCIVLEEVHKIEGVSQCVVLSTCNRTEIYTLCNGSPEKVSERIDEYILKKTGKSSEFLGYFYRLRGKEVIEHLFKVTCGIESMIVGEPQILGQVKNAYSAACDRKCTGPAINRLFHHAFQVGKSIRNLTSIGEGSVSVSSAAIKLARDIFGSFTNLSAMLIGAGEIGTSCAKQFYHSGLKNFYIANRSPEKAKHLAEAFSATTIPLREIENFLDNIDIVITSVSLSEPIINSKIISASMNKRNGKPLFLVDLGVPRNIDPETADIEHVHLFDIDDLENVIFDNHDKRCSEAEKAHGIIEKETDEFCRWLMEREAIPVIQEFRAKCESLRTKELERIINTVTPETFEVVELVTRRLIRKLLHNPTIKLRVLDKETRDRLMESIQELFSLKDTKDKIGENSECEES